MNGKDAIEILKFYESQPYFFSGDAPAMNAFRMAIEALEAQQENETKLNNAINRANEFNQELFKAREEVELLKTQLEAQQADRWIPVTKYMPKINENCRVTTEKGEVTISRFYGYGEECQGFREYPEGVWEINTCGEDVIAWKPLDKPWEGESK